MNIRFLLPFFLLCLQNLLLAQNTTWHQVFPVSPFNAGFCNLTNTDDGFLINTDKAMVQLDQTGRVSGFAELPILGIYFISSVLKRQDPTSGNPYFITSRRHLNHVNHKEFILAGYHPGVGIVDEIVLSDSISSLTWARLQMLETGDNTFLIFGRTFYWKFSYTPNGGFVQEWKRPLGMAPVKVLKLNNQIIMADETGRLQAIDEDGNLLWQRQYAIEFRAIEEAPGGLIGCGRNDDDKAVVIKINDDGMEVWTKTFSEHIFYDITPTADGGYVATGQSAGLSGEYQIHLVKTGLDGSVTWRRAMGAAAGNGGGSAVSELPDGGFLIAGKTKLELVVIRTDAAGNAPVPVEAQIKQRRLQTASLQSDFFPAPSLFFDGSRSRFVSLADSGASPMLVYSPWLAGLVDNQEIRVAAAEYSPSYPSDFRMGTHATLAADFDRVWAVSREEIRALRLDFLQDKKLDAPVPDDLLSWPGRGNPHFKYRLDFSPVQTNPMDFPAPFVDVNGDGLYNVYDGDYPKLKGDRMVWWIFTDSTQHKLTNNGTPLLVDFQATVFAYDCVETALLDQSLFAEFELINRSEINYTGTYLGFFSDPDLGCYVDDYFGSLPAADAWFIYNQDSVDGQIGACSDVKIFGTEIPVQSISFLDKTLDHTMYSASNSFGLINPGIADPVTRLDYYRYLQGKWRDGTPLTVGGDGYNQFNLNITNHVFSGNPNDPQGWSMCTQNLNFLERRVVSSHGPFDFAAGDTFRIQVAFTLHRDIPHPCPDVHGQVSPPLKQLQLWHDEDLLDMQSGMEPVYALPAGRILSLDATVPAGSYAWSTGSMEPVFVVSAPGHYAVTITGATGCTRTETILVQAATGANSPPGLSNWTIRPNPARDLVYLDCPDCDLSSLQAMIFNSQGQLLRQVSAATTLDVQALHPGVYWLELRDAWGWQGVKKLVVAR